MPSFEKAMLGETADALPGLVGEPDRTATSGKFGPAGVTAALQAKIARCRDPLRSREPASADVMQGDSADAGRDVEAGIAFDAQRLKRDRLIRTANQHVGPDSDPDRRAGRGAGKIPG
jgi:hypothetical protein